MGEMKRSKTKSEAAEGEAAECFLLLSTTAMKLSPRNDIIKECVCYQLFVESKHSSVGLRSEFACRKDDD